ncbi:MAG: ATP-binding cassette domain-containing protein [Pirellulales bacterium]|nr:ATP-binding cassette domain-containing protein [Pirellulales bacterium]
MLAIHGISKCYGQTVALHPATISFIAGKTTALIGPSGCGKSTLLRLLVGLIPPDQGIIQFDGEELREDNLQAIRRRLGYVIQEGGLFPHLTARDNISLMASRLDWSDSQIDERLSELCSLTKFPRDGLNRFPAELSGGQRQRVSLMRALMLRPKVLLLDEPLGALDPLIRADLQRDLREIFRAAEATVILVTHDMGEAAYLADSIVLMRAGKIVQQGLFQDLWRQPADEYVTEFINAQRSPLETMTVEGEAQ